jgi:hypothetical protein
VVLGMMIRGLLRGVLGRRLFTRLFVTEGCNAPATNTALYLGGKFPDFSSRGRQQKRAELRRAAFARVCDRQMRVTDRSVQYPFGVTRRERREAARIVASVVWEVQ